MQDQRADSTDPDPGAMGYDAWIRGQCKYECAICLRKFSDR